MVGSHHHNECVMADYDNDQNGWMMYLKEDRDSNVVLHNRPKSQLHGEGMVC